MAREEKERQEAEDEVARTRQNALDDAAKELAAAEEKDRLEKQAKAAR